MGSRRNGVTLYLLGLKVLSFKSPKVILAWTVTPAGAGEQTGDLWPLQMLVVVSFLVRGSNEFSSSCRIVNNQGKE